MKSDKKLHFYATLFNLLRILWLEVKRNYLESENVQLLLYLFYYIILLYYVSSNEL